MAKHATAEVNYTNRDGKTSYDDFDKVIFNVLAPLKNILFILSWSAEVTNPKNDIKYKAE